MVVWLVVPWGQEGSGFHSALGPRIEDLLDSLSFLTRTLLWLSFDKEFDITMVRLMFLILGIENLCFISFLKDI